ncbi:unnamed protein product [Parnassius apollo]|uniref:(apollo) hypothetical protein n=1 Tax=Parnassius apollo TaxID=110799 RepID=A0A8S3Y329_PARAO|nr:unnamed protein product [Parnassius apollo]
MYRLLGFLFFLTGALGQVTLNGTCNFTDISAVRDLNITKLSGDWHQIRRIMNSQESGTCSTTKINATFTNSTSNITISNKEVNNKKKIYRNGTINLNNITRGKLFISYPDIAYDSIILATNYTNYAVLYSCKNNKNATKKVWAWVLSRDTTLNKNEEDMIKSVIYINEDLKNATWIDSDHSKEACDANSSTSFRLSIILTSLTLIFVCKDIL